MKNEFKCSDVSFMHNHTLHDTLHQMYVFLFEIGMQSEKGFCVDKSFRKTFGEKKDNSNRLEISKNHESQPSWQSRVSPDRYTDKIKSCAISIRGEPR